LPTAATAEAVTQATIQKRPAQNAENLKVPTPAKKPAQKANPYPRPLRLEVINQPVLTFIVSTGFLF
jgi:hypothetical protein